MVGPFTATWTIFTLFGKTICGSRWFIGFQGSSESRFAVTLTLVAELRASTEGKRLTRGSVSRRGYRESGVRSEDRGGRLQRAVGVLPVNRHLEVARMPLCQRA